MCTQLYTAVIILYKCVYTHVRMCTQLLPRYSSTMVGMVLLNLVLVVVPLYRCKDHVEGTFERIEGSKYYLGNATDVRDEA